MSGQLSRGTPCTQALPIAGQHDGTTKKVACIHTSTNNGSSSGLQGGIISDPCLFVPGLAFRCWPVDLEEAGDTQLLLCVHASIDPGFQLAALVYLSDSQSVTSRP